MRKGAAAAAGMMMLAGATAASAAFKVTVEQPKVENSTSLFTVKGVETFDTRGTGAGQTFTTDFGTGGKATTISGTYTGIQVDAANQFGSAGGTGNHATIYDGTGYALDLVTNNAGGINYFGYWLSALDRGNQLAFYKGGTLVYSFAPADVLALVSGNAAYYGNPDAPYAGQGSSEPFAFLNFYDQDGSFDRVVFSESPQVGGYESDNHTVGYYTTQTGTTVTPVPEPATWAMFIGGFALVGAALRGTGRRRALAA